MRVLELKTGLYPDGNSVEAALDGMEPEDHVHRIDPTVPGSDDAFWDMVVNEILAADRIVTV